MNFKFIKTLFIGLALLTFSGIYAQTSYPKVNTGYSIQQIDSLYNRHNIDDSRDIKSPPEKITNSFGKNFPEAKDIEWEQSGILFEVEFKTGSWLSKKEYKAYYTYDGDLIMYKAELEEKDLPGVVINSALAKYPNFKFEEIDKVVKGKETYYNVELENGNKEVKLTIMHDGKII